MGTLELIEKKLIWKNEHDKWCFPCKNCGRIREYKTSESATVVFRKNCKCKICMVDNDFRLRSKLNGGKPTKNGKPRGYSLRGRKKGTTPKEICEKIRQAHLNRNRCIEHSSRIDDGANEWFEMMNGNGYYFCQNCQFPPMSYKIDGYDAYHHIVVEYDTPYHKHYLRQHKDADRQKNIIEYWEKKGKPLSQFLRVNAKEKGNIKVEIVYQTKTALQIPLIKNCDFNK